MKQRTRQNPVIRAGLLFGLLLLIFSGCRAEPSAVSTRKEFIRQHRSDRFDLPRGASTIEQALVMFLQDAADGVPLEKNRVLTSEKEYLSAFWASLPDEEILPPAMAPESAWELAKQMRELVYPSLQNALSKKRIQGVHYREKQTRDTHAVRLHYIADVEAQTEAGPVWIGDEVKVVLEHRGRFVIVTVSPSRD